MIQLSPALRHYLKHPGNPEDCQRLDSDKGKRDRVEVITMYRCAVCESMYGDRMDAEECCAPAGLHDQDGLINCPVCGAGHKDEHNAADCCLWKDIDAPTRWKIADAVELGATWEEAIGEFAC